MLSAGLPLGWLWATMTESASTFSASEKTSFGLTVAVDSSPGQSMTSLHAGRRAKSSAERALDAHLANSPNSSRENDFEHPTAHRPFSGTGRTLLFSTRFTPIIMRTAYGPVHVKAEVIMA